MAITEYRPREEYVGTGSLDTYSFGFKVASAAQVLVAVYDEDGVETFRVRGTDTTYLTSCVVDAVDGGGEIVLVDDLPANHNMVILQANDTPLQEVEFRDKRDFTLKRFEAALDVVVGQIQRLSYLVGRSLKLPEKVLDAVDFNAELDDVAEDTLLAISPTGDQFVLGPSVPYLEGLVAAAEAAEDGAQAAEATAVAASNAAEISEDNAANSAEDAATSAAEASADRILAGTSAANAAASAAAALVSENNAETAETNAETAENNAEVAAAAALNSQNLAAASELAAAASAAAAALSEAAAAAAVFGVFTYVPTITAAGAESPAPGPLSSASYRFDATAGNQSLTLPTIADPTDDGLMYEVIKIDNSVNTVTITGTVSGEVNPVIEYQWTRRVVKAIGGDWYWAD
jgi:hypothetical protein